jgi:hypothetical protein
MNDTEPIRNISNRDVRLPHIRASVLREFAGVRNATIECMVRLLRMHAEAFAEAWEGLISGQGNGHDGNILTRGSVAGGGDV